MYARGNTLIGKFKILNEAVKIQLYKSFIYPLYCASLWSSYRVSTVSRLRVGYNTILRRLMGVKLWNEEAERVESISALFVQSGIRSFPEQFRSISYGCMNRIEKSENKLVKALLESEAKITSRQWNHWSNLLYV